MATNVPEWAAALDDEDWQFLKRFLLASGSLEALAEVYDISYPTVRGRLDRLIAKVQAADAPQSADPLERKVRLLVAEGKLSAALAKELIAVHLQSQKKGKER